MRLEVSYPSSQTEAMFNSRFCWVCGKIGGDSFGKWGEVSGSYGIMTCQRHKEGLVTWSLVKRTEIMLANQVSFYNWTGTGVDFSEANVNGSPA